MTVARNFAALLLAFLLLAGNAVALESFEKSSLVIHTDKGPKTFQVEMAVTPQQQAQGLMFRRRLAHNSGMLFPYKAPSEVSFWMKNTFIPLDLFFIAADGRIANIHERAVPQSLSPMRSKGKVLAVLELNGGSASRFGIKLGDRVEHPIFEK